MNESKQRNKINKNKNEIAIFNFHHQTVQAFISRFQNINEDWNRKEIEQDSFDIRKSNQYCRMVQSQLLRLTP